MIRVFYVVVFFSLMLDVGKITALAINNLCVMAAISGLVKVNLTAEVAGLFTCKCDKELHNSIYTCKK
jgi:hypothetical protein